MRKKLVSPTENKLLTSLLAAVNSEDYSFIIGIIESAINEYNNDLISVDEICEGNFNSLIAVLNEWDFQERQSEADTVITFLHEKTAEFQLEDETFDSISDGDDEPASLQPPASNQKLKSIIKTENESALDNWLIQENRSWNKPEDLADVLHLSVQNCSYSFILSLFRRTFIELNIHRENYSLILSKELPLLEFHFSQREFDISFNEFIQASFQPLESDMEILMKKKVSDAIGKMAKEIEDEHDLIKIFEQHNLVYLPNSTSLNYLLNCCLKGMDQNRFINFFKKSELIAKIIRHYSPLSDISLNLISEHLWDLFLKVPDFALPKELKRNNFPVEKWVYVIEELLNRRSHLAVLTLLGEAFIDDIQLFETILLHTYENLRPVTLTLSTLILCLNQEDMARRQSFYTMITLLPPIQNKEGKELEKLYSFLAEKSSLSILNTSSTSTSPNKTDPSLELTRKLLSYSIGMFPPSAQGKEPDDKYQASSSFSKS